MAHSMEATESVRAVVDDISSSGGDYYVRWTMDIRFTNYNDGKVACSVGISPCVLTATARSSCIAITGTQRADYTNIYRWSAG